MADESMVHHPQHYNTGKMEVIDAIVGLGLGFFSGNILKYNARAEHKGKKVEDLEKAGWYMRRWIAEAKLEENLPLTENEKLLFRYGPPAYSTLPYEPGDIDIKISQEKQGRYDIERKDEDTYIQRASERKVL